MKKYLSYALGAFGHDALYQTLSMYFMIFVTSVLFTHGDKAQNAKMIGIVTTLMVVIRIGEIMFDPVIGGVVDNTKTKWGKFKPWILTGSLVASIGIILIFSDFGGLTYSNPLLYTVIFALTFLLLDIFYSFSDIAFWSMLPALSMEANERNKYGTVSRFGSTLGAQSVIIIITPLVLFFSRLMGGKPGQETGAGWLGYAVVIAILCVGGATLTVLNTNEAHSAIRENTKHTKLIDVFKVIAQNDQLLWIALSYFLFAFSYVVTNSLMMYYFRYRLGNIAAFTWVGVITCILGVISVSLYPVLQPKIGRKNIYLGGIGVMLLGYLVFVFAGDNLALVLTASGLLFLPYPLIFLSTLMHITDCVEYGQLKNGTRHESVTLSVRPLIDKLAGAFSNGVVGIVAVGAGMTGNAKPSDITSAGLLEFNSFMFYLPMILLCVSMFIFWKEVNITESAHAKILVKLQAKFGDQEHTAKSGAKNIDDKNVTDINGHITISNN
ncbi:glycoside-pentoside-hexuronide (GPH):cation symporter [Lentilactobacillus senioris]|uniref:glycoside-pentoside-hexuronide (GPH):cation symporter n=1 Tax=Lentilactobacillus senioris TaxID=931534 RepID=UPI003D2B0059